MANRNPLFRLPLENNFEDLTNRVVPGPDLDVWAHNSNGGVTIVAIPDFSAMRDDIEMAFAGRILQRPTKSLLRFP